MPNDRGYGLGRPAGEFPVATATKEMRAQNPLNARQPANEHRRVLCACLSLLILRNNNKKQYETKIIIPIQTYL